LLSTYGFEQGQMSGVLICARCGYPAPVHNVWGGIAPSVSPCLREIRAAKWYPNEVMSDIDVSDVKD